MADIPALKAKALVFSHFSSAAPDYHNARRALAKAIEDAGITYDKKTERVGFHGFRHGAVSALIRAGKDPVGVAAFVGDKVETILSTYAHLWKKDGDNLGQDLESEVLSAEFGASPRG